MGEEDNKYFEDLERLDEAVRAEERAEMRLDELRDRITELEAQLKVSPEGFFRSGEVQAEIDEGAGATTECPYAADTPERHWWTRGYAHMARILRALKAEKELAEVKQHDRRITILAAEFAGELGAESMKRLSQAAGRAVEIQTRIERLEAALKKFAYEANWDAPDMTWKCEAHPIAIAQDALSGAPELKAVQEIPCIVYPTKLPERPTCVWLRDGMKIGIERDWRGDSGAVWLRVEPTPTVQATDAAKGGE